ncbi:MAG: hypothetical protein PHC41_05490 [Lachnospiraceae bacterium]|nr:hypothetical protein [Lachnospiraceae bacterium]MDD3615663.1 hypothetical protein [Lachnospiraceae bacterium]
MTEQWQTIQEKIEDADAILCGIGSGMSSSAGYNHYHKNSFFEENFSEFEEQYGYDNLFQGFLSCISNTRTAMGILCKIYSNDVSCTGRKGI